MFGQTPATIYTPNGSLVQDTYIIGGSSPQYTQAQLDGFSSYLDSNYDGAQMITPPDNRYNCHAYAWYMYWEDNPQMVWMGYDTTTAEDIYVQDNSYEEVPESLATVVSYYGNHSAIRENSTWYRSKWGANYLVRHHPNSVPNIYHAEMTKTFYKLDMTNLGTYSQVDNFNLTHEWDIPETSLINHTHLICRPKCDITLQSLYFVGANVTYSGDSPSTWTNNNNGTINLKYPYSANTWKYTTISVSTTGGNVLYRFYIDVMPAGGLILDNPYLEVCSSGHSLQVTLKGDDVRTDIESRNNKTDISWNLRIVNLMNGQQMYLGKIEEWTKSVDTSNWPVGIYAIMAQCGEKLISQKYVIK